MTIRDSCGLYFRQWCWLYYFCATFCTV